jgi:hypothetical protein
VQALEQPLAEFLGIVVHQRAYRGEDIDGTYMLLLNFHNACPPNPGEAAGPPRSTP